MDVVFSCPSGEIRVCSAPSLSDDQCPSFVCVPQITDVKIVSDGKPLKEGEIFSHMPLAFEAVTKPNDIGNNSIIFNVYRKKAIVVAAAASETGDEQLKTAASETGSDDIAAASAASGQSSLASSFPDDEYEPNPAFFCSTISGQKQCGAVVLDEGRYKVEAKFINYQNSPSHNKVFYVTYGTVQIDLKGAALYIHSSDSSFTGYPTKSADLPVNGIDIRVIVVAKEKHETKYSAYTVGSIEDYSRWFAPGSEGSLSGDFSKVTKANAKTAPTLEQHLNNKKPEKDDLFKNLADKRIKQWPYYWPEPEFKWEKMEHKGSPPLQGTDSSRNYWYENESFSQISGWGSNITSIEEGATRYRVSVKIPGREQVVSSRDKEYALRLSVGDADYGTDANGTEFLRYVSGFLGIPYEWGGHWYGGKEGNGVGQKSGYEGYGTDCSGLVSAAAYLAGYSWATQKYATSGLETVSREITFNELKPGDILNRIKVGKKEGHVYVVVKVDNINDRLTIGTIDAIGGNVSIVRMLYNSIDYYNGFTPRRLCNSILCK
jgi:hypothetical protein